MKIIHMDDPDYFDAGFFSGETDVYSASITSWSSTKITFTNSDTGAKTHLTGTGFSVDGLGNITAGTITKFKFKDGSVTNSVWKNVNWSGTDWQAAVDEFETEGNALFAALFADEPLVYDASNYTSADETGVSFGSSFNLDPRWFNLDPRFIVFIGSIYDDNAKGTNSADTISGGRGDDFLSGKGGKDKMYGGNGHDILAGGGGNDILKGGNGHDKLNGGKGDDALTGAAGGDKFIFSSTQIGADTITDFTDNVDTLKLDDALWGGGLSKADVIATYASVVAGDVVFDFGSGQMITLTGISDTASLLNDLVLF